MGRKKLNKFKDPKMFSSRVERENYEKFEIYLKKTGRSLQDMLNSFMVSCISGSVQLSGSLFVGKYDGDN